MIEIPVYFIDAFTDKQFRGNPAAVCVLEDQLTVDQMRDIAKEIGFSETCFVMANHDMLTPTGSEHFFLRWFTPEVEVNLCGHGTLATAFVLWQINKDTPTTLYFHTKSGILPVYKKDDLIELDFPLLPVVISERAYPDLFESLGLPLSGLFESEVSKYLLIETTPELLHDMKVDFYRLSKVPIHPFTSIIITSRGDSNYDFYSRCFAVWEGINEDPVTGSAHCVLASYWQRLLPERVEFKAFQSSARGGEIIIKIKNDRVRLRGKATLFLKGKIFLENA